MITKSFDSLTSFVMHLAAAEVAVHLAEHRALDQAARLIEREAKAEIGHYQPEVGPFPAWAPLADSTEKQKENAGYPANAPLLATGEMRDSIRREVAGNEAVVGSDEEKMVWHELGTSKMPARPVLGPAAFKNQEAIGKLIGAHVVSAILHGAVVVGGEQYFYGK